MKIICISGKAQHGKDFTASIISSLLKSKGKKVLITHYADLLKHICQSMFDWDGKKDEKGRHLLQYVGTDIVRKQNPNFWVEYMLKILELFKNEWDYVIIPDCRFPNEIDTLKASNFDVKTLKVIRCGFDNGLSKEAQNHPSENALADYKYDYELYNNGDEDYIKEIKKIFFNLFCEMNNN